MTSGAFLVPAEEVSHYLEHFFLEVKPDKMFRRHRGRIEANVRATRDYELDIDVRCGRSSLVAQTKR